jgi:ATP-dependent Lon protease
MGAYIFGGIGSAVYVAIISAIYKKNLKAGLAVLRKYFNWWSS